MKRSTRILTTILLISAALVTGQFVFAQGSERFAIDKEWSLAKTHGDITISTRTTHFSDSEIRETKATILIHQSLSSTVRLLEGNSDIWRSLKRMAYLNDFNITPDKKTWNSYFQFDMPWPFHNQDVIVRCHVEHVENSNQVRIIIESVPNLVPKQKGVTRVEKFSSVWLLDEIDMNSTRVQYIGKADGKGFLPQWITDPIVHRNLITLLESLSSLSQDTMAFQDKN